MSDDNSYSDDDLVYVDPAQRTVVGAVEFDAKGNPKSLPYKSATEEKTWRKFFPFGTYRSMKGVFRIDGKRIDEDRDLTLDAALPMALNDEL